MSRLLSALIKIQLELHFNERPVLAELRYGTAPAQVRAGTCQLLPSDEKKSYNLIGSRLLAERDAASAVSAGTEADNESSLTDQQKW
jgi:hypothetical protein